MEFNFKKFDETKRDIIWEWCNAEFPDATFLTSLEWMEFQKSLGKEVEQYVVTRDEGGIDVIAALLYIEISRRKIAKYAYLPYGPVVSPSIIEDQTAQKEFFTQFSEFGKKYCEEKGLNLFKIDPAIEKTKLGNNLKDTGWSKSMSIGQAKDTWVMTLLDDKEEQMKELKKDTRYYVRRAKKKGVVVKKAESIEYVKKFSALMKETELRQGFINYSSSYYENQWSMLNEEGLTDVFVAEFEGTPVAGALINYYNGIKTTAYYAHGASTSNKKLANLAAPYYLHWYIIEDLIKRKFMKYNFWGVIPKEIKHEWRGLSSFKMKFPGELVSYPGPHEVYPSKSKYLINRLFDWWAFRNERY